MFRDVFDVRCYTIIYYYITIILYTILFLLLFYTLLSSSPIFSSSYPSPLPLLPLPPFPFPIFILYLSVVTYTYLYSIIFPSLPYLSCSSPLIHSIRVGTYIRSFISNPPLLSIFSLLPSPSPILSSLSFLPKLLISIYTCRWLVILIYIPDSSDNSDPACFIGVDG